MNWRTKLPKKRYQQVLLGLVLLLAISLSILLIPNVQKKIVIAQAEKYTESFQLGYIHILPWSVEIKDLHLTIPSLEATLATVDTSFCLTKLLWKVLDVKELALLGAEIKIRDTGEPATVFSFPGLFATLDRGYRLSLGQLRLDAVAVLPDETSVSINIPNGNLSAEGRGEIPLTVVAQLPAADLEISTEGMLAVIQSGTGGIEEIFSPLSVVVAPKSQEAFDFDLDLVMTPWTDTYTDPETESIVKNFLGDDVNAHISIPNRRSNGVSLETAFRYDGGKSMLDGSYELAISEQWLEALIGNQSAPLMSENGSGEFTFQILPKLLALNYNGDTRFSTLERLLKQNPALPDFLRFNKSLDVTTDFTTATINSLATGMSNAGGISIFTLGLTDPIDVTLADPNAILATDKTIARFEVSKVPIEWVDSLVTEASLQQGQISGEFLLETKDEVVRLLPVKPLQLSATKILAKDLPEQLVSVSVEPQVFYTREELRAEISKLSFTVEDQQALDLELAMRLPFSEENPPMAVTAKGGAALDRIKSLSAFDSLNKQHPTPDGLTLAFDSSFLVYPERVSIRKVNFDLARNDSSIFNVLGLQPLAINFNNLTAVDFNQGALARLNIANIELDWANPYSGALQLDGDLISGAFDLINSGDGGFSLNATDTLRLRDFDLTQDGDALVRNLGIELRPSIALSEENIQLNIADLQVNKGGKNIVLGDSAIRLPRAEDGVDPNNLNFSGRTRLNVNELSKLKALSAVVDYDFGKTQWQTALNYDIDYQGDRITLNDFDAKVMVNKVERLALISNGKTRIRPKIAKNDALAQHITGNLGVKINGVTATEIKDLVDLGGLSFNAINGRFALRSDGQRLSASFEEPIVVSGVSVKSKDSPLINAFDLLVAGKINTTGANLDADFHDISLTFVSDQSKPAVAGDLSLRLLPDRSVPIETLVGNLRGDIPLLLRQPAIMPGHSLASGAYTLSAQVDPSGAISGNATLNGLVANKPLAINEFSAEISGKMADDGKGFEFDMPLRGSGRTGETTGNLSAVFAPKKDKKSRLSLNFTSAKFFLNDLLAAASAISTTKPASDKKKEKTEKSQAPKKIVIDDTPDNKAFWNVLPLDAVLAYNIAQLYYTDYVIFNDVSGEILITPEQLDINQLSAFFHDSPMKFAGRLKFFEKNPSPYDVKLDGTVRDFNLNQFFSELVPGVKPRVEGLFGVSIDAFGSSPNMEQFRNNLFFDTRLQSREGLFRPLPPDSGLMVGASDVLGIVGEGLSYMPTGGFGAGALSRLVNYIKEIDYDVIDIHITRGDSRDIFIEQFLVQSPTVRLTAAGGIDYEYGKDVLDSPLTLDARMSMSGKGAAILYSMDLLEDEEDSFGYTLGPKFEIRGTPNEPQSNFADILSAGAKGTVAGGITRPISGLIGNVKHRWFGDDTKPANTDFELPPPNSAVSPENAIDNAPTDQPSTP